MIFDPKTLPDYESRMEAARLYEEFVRLDDAVVAIAETAGGVSLEPEHPASVARDDAFDAYESHGVDLLTDGDGYLIRCALTGVPLLAEADDTEFVLAAAVRAKESEAA